MTSGDATGSHHIYFELTNPEGWVFYAAPGDVPLKRLVVFVHGFGGQSVGTWANFHRPASGTDAQWWREADLLFVGYNSLKDSVVGVAQRLRSMLPHFYPVPFQSPHLIRIAEPTPTYTELVVLGHSLGGLIVRRAICDSVQHWQQCGEPDNDRPPLIDAHVRLFSPAIGGFRPGGALGMAKAAGTLRLFEIFIRKASAYTDLQRGSDVLTTTRSRTENLARQRSELSALFPLIVWASPDNVVVEERYDTDIVDTAWDNTTHSSVCKPTLKEFEQPWAFARTQTQEVDDVTAG